MRHLLSFQSGRALFGNPRRIALVFAILLTFFVVGLTLGPFVPWWIVTLAGVVLFICLMLLGSTWSDRDIMTASKEESRQG